MRRRKYLEGISGLATSPLVLPAVGEAAGNLSDDSENQPWSKLDAGHRTVHSRGVENEIFVYVDKVGKVDEPKVTVKNNHTGKVVNHIRIYEGCPSPHIGDYHSIVFTRLEGEKISVFVPYYQEITHGEQGWISVDNTI